jgi:hypothetical protein
MAAAIAEAAQRGSAARFPQLLIGVRYWLPFRRSVIIAATTWRGESARFGSVQALAAELDQMGSLIAEIGSSAAIPPAEAATPARIPRCVARTCALMLAEFGSSRSAVTAYQVKPRSR